ncbi:Putative ribonuclease H protein At1g65750, partial [Linum perenne]
SHLFYADDLILFAEASVSQAAAILNCLDRFSDASGLAVSKEKSALLCSKNTDRQTCALISARLGISLTQNLGKYLGVPVLHECTTMSTYQEVLARMDSKLAGWKTKSLRLAGRVTLAQSVLAAIPAYLMQTSVLPIDTCNQIDKKIRAFVWGSSASQKNVHLISWEAIYRPKEEGGLGLRSARTLNLAYLAKLAFLFLHELDALWVRVLHTKYLKEVADGFSPTHRSS